MAFQSDAFQGGAFQIGAPVTSAPVTPTEKLATGDIQTRLIRGRRFLTAPDVPPNLPIAAVHPSYELLKANRREGWRKLQVPLDVPNTYTPTPAVMPAHVLEKANRRHGWRKLQTLPELDQFTQATPPSDKAVADPFVTRQVRNRRFLTAPAVPVANATPAVVELGWLQRVDAKRVRGPRDGRTFEWLDLITANEAAPASAWKRADANRRHGWRKAQRAADYVSASVVPTPVDYAATVQSRANRRVGWVKAKRSAEYISAQPVAAPVEYAALVLQKANSRHGWRKERHAPDYISATAVPTPAVYASLILEKVNRRHGWRKVQTLPDFNDRQAPAPTQPISALTHPDAFRRHSWRKLRTALDVPEFPETPTPPVEEVHGGHFGKPKHHKSKITRSEREQIEAVVREAFDRLEGIVPEPVAVEAKRSVRVQLKQIDLSSYDAAIAATHAVLDDIRILIEVYEAERDDEETILMLL